MADGNPGDQVPRPDPTTLTTEQMLREVGNLERLLLARIIHEAELCTVQFENVEKQFGESAKRTAEQKQDVKAAVDDALRAAKEAVAAQTAASDRSIAKSEAATAKEIDALKAQLAASDNASGEKLTDVKSRLDRIEAGKLGGRESQANTISYVSIAAAVVVAFIVVAAFIINNKP